MCLEEADEKMKGRLKHCIEGDGDIGQPISLTAVENLYILSKFEERNLWKIVETANLNREQEVSSWVYLNFLKPMLIENHSLASLEHKLRQAHELAPGQYPVLEVVIGEHQAKQDEYDDLQEEAIANARIISRNEL